jgi:hypothetical protein
MRDEARVGDPKKDGRLLTLDDTVECSSLVLGIPLTAPEKRDLVEFLRAL